MKSILTNVTSTIFKKTILLLGAVSCVALLASSETYAQSIETREGAWTQIASACTPDEDSIDYQFSGAGVSFPGSISGEITLRCNITNVQDPDFAWNTLEVVYRDPDGNGTTNQVKVTLHKVGLNGTAESTVTTTDPRTGRPLSVIDPSLVATFDSNTQAAAVSSTQVHKVGINHNFDFETNAYYVKIKVKRSEGVTTNPAAFVIRVLFNNIQFFG